MYYSNIKYDRYNVKSKKIKPLKKISLHEVGTVQYVITALGRLRQDTMSSSSAWATNEFQDGLG